MEFMLKNKSALILAMLVAYSHAVASSYDSILGHEESGSIVPIPHVNVAHDDIAVCLVLEEECDKVFDPKNSRFFEYGREDELVMNKLIQATSESVDEARSHEYRLLSDKAVEIAAKTLGEQTGFVVGVRRLSSFMARMSDVYERSINATFASLMLVDAEGRMIQPSIIDVSHDNIAIHKKGKVFRASSQNFYIRKPARFVPSPPTFQSYLLVEYNKPKLPNSGLMPKNPRQVLVWEKGIKSGYKQGLLNAQRIYIHRLNQIKNDIQGMVRYHMLRAYNMVSEPKIKIRRRNVLGGGERMSIDTQMVTLEVTPMLNASIDNWKSLPRLPDISHFNLSNDDVFYNSLESEVK